MKSFRIVLGIVALTGAMLLTPAAWAQSEGSMAAPADSAQQDLQRSLQELSALRESISAERLPLTRKLREIEDRLVGLRADFDEASRTLDKRNLELNNIKTEIDAREQERSYTTGLLDEYIRNLETRVHIAELPRYRDALAHARMASGDSTLTPTDVYRTQAGLVDSSLGRLLDLMGGARFDGSAIAPDGTMQPVTFALLGPLALYSRADGSAAGMAELRIGSLEPNMIPYDDPQQTAAVKSLVATGTGLLPFDPTLGSARQLAEVNDSLLTHIGKGGVVMYPILLLAGAAFLVAIYKLWHILRVPNPSRAKVQGVLDAVKRGDMVKARATAKELRGPSAEMLQAGLEHIDSPKELVEEVMFERMLDTRLKLQTLLPFVAVCAAAAPLLGLLGTVTGIINTFKMITVFGTGDAKSLSSGISEALITTEFGLIIAIPSLLMHAYLSRRARRIVDGMEKNAVSFLNRIPGREITHYRDADSDGTPTRAGGRKSADPVPGIAGFNPTVAPVASTER